MRKYVAIAKIWVKMQITYRFDVALTAIETIGRVLFAWLIWGAVFAGRETVSGFSFEAMLLYYVVSSFLITMGSFASIGWEVSANIRDGKFTRFMVIPTNPLTHYFVQALSSAGYFSLFALPVAIFSGLVFGAGVFAPRPMAVLCAFAMLLAGMVFMTSYHFFLGLMAFKFQDARFFLYFQDSIISFTQGGMIPLNLLPVQALSLLLFLPFPHVVFTPAMLLTGNMSQEEGLFSLWVLTVWTIVMVMVSQLTYNRMRVKYDGVGI